jgi:hypothetical protein
LAKVRNSLARRVILSRRAGAVVTFSN